jgi:hypothetical protein
MKKKHIRFISLFLLVFGWVYAAIFDSNNVHYEIDSDPHPVCITWPAWYLTEYDLTYHNNSIPYPNLFIPKKTSGEFLSFINAAVIPNSFSVTGVFSDWEHDCNLTGLSCNYWDVRNFQHECNPDGTEDITWDCITACWLNRTCEIRSAPAYTHCPH